MTAHPVTDWDVIVVGAGPAGTSAALAARRADPGARVLLVDRADFPRDKVCGDGVAPQALDVLAALGVDIEALVAGTAPIGRLRLESPGGVVAARPLVRAARVVPRLLFDARLVQAALDAGAVFERRRVRSVTPGADGVLVDGELTAGVVIGADGAESSVRRALAPICRPGSVALALRGYADASTWPAHEQLLRMSRTGWPAYAWVFPVGDGRANVGYGEILRGSPPSRAHLTERLHTLLPETVGLPGTDGVDLRGHRLPLSTGRPSFGRHGRVLLTGDAASLINPITGEGIYYAVLSGSLAGAAAVGEAPATRYRRAMRDALGRHLRHTDALATLTRAPAVVDAAVRAARGSQPTFDALVELGLGAGLVGPRTAGSIVGSIAGSVVGAVGGSISGRPR